MRHQAVGLFILTHLCLNPVFAKTAVKASAVNAFSKMEEEKNVKEKGATRKSPDKIKKAKGSLDKGGIAQKLPPIERLNTQIEAMENLVKIERDPIRVTKFRANLAVLYFQRAQNRRFSGKGVSEEEKKDLISVVQRTTQVLDDKKSDKAYLDMSLYIRSLAYVELEQRKKAVEDLVKLISSYPESKFAPGASVYVGEYYFENENYKDALKYYERYLKDLPKEQQILSIYKMAWSKVNILDYDGAKKDFLYIINKETKSEFAQDALKDLAFLVVLNANESEILNYSESFFANNPPAKLAFLTSAFQNIYHNKGVTKADLLLNKILSLETDPQKRFQIWLHEVRNRRKNYASMLHAEAVEKMSEEVSQSFKPGQIPPEVGQDAEAELNSIIRSFVDTFNGGVKNQEHLSKPDMSAKLFKFFSLHAKTFPESKLKGALFELWLGFCEEINDTSCVAKLSKMMTGEGFSDDTKYKASLSRLVAVEQIYLKDKAKNQAEYVTTLQQFMTNFPTKPEYHDVADKLAAIKMQDKDYDSAIPLLQQVHEKKQNPESFRRLMTAYFMSGQYDKVLNTSVPDFSANDTAISDLQRESSLKLAAHSRNDKTQDDAYEKHIDKYMQLSTDKKKSALVGADYLAKCIEQKEYGRARRKIKEWGSDVVSQPEVQAQIVALLKLHLSQVQGPEGAELCDQIKNTSQYTYECSLLKHLTGEPFSFHAINKLTGDKKDYLLGIHTLLYPRMVVDAFKVEEPNLNEGEKKIVFLAYQIQQEKKRPELSASETKYFSAYLPAYEKELPLTAIEKKIQGVRFPEIKKMTPQAQKNMLATIETVQKTRSEVVASLKSAPPLVQMRIVASAADLEVKTATMIQGSAVPGGLSPEQVNQYKEGLKQAAQEFNDQKAEYDKLKVKISESVKKGQAQYESLKVLPWSPQTWFWPKDEVSQAAKKMLLDKKYLHAMIYIDLQRGSKKLGETEYTYLRTATLLLAQRTDFMKDFVYRELEQNKKTEVIKKWESLSSSAHSASL